MVFNLALLQPHPSPKLQTLSFEPQTSCHLGLLDADNADGKELPKAGVGFTV